MSEVWVPQQQWSLAIKPRFHAFGRCVCACSLELIDVDVFYIQTCVIQILLQIKKCLQKITFVTHSAASFFFLLRERGQTITIMDFGPSLFQRSRCAECFAACKWSPRCSISLSERAVGVVITSVHEFR